MIGGPKVFTEAHKFICREETGVSLILFACLSFAAG